MTSTAVWDGLSIAVLLPCCNEASTIGAVVRGFVAALPGARIYAFDNNSTDDTARAASLAGARVFREGRQGKRNVVRRMFADIEADIYVMADADGSCDPADASSLVNALVTEHVDMVVGTRRGIEMAGRSGRQFAGQTAGRLCSRLLGGGFTDIFSGYRAFTRRFVKSFPALPSGFDIETEMSVHASQLMIPVAEIELNYGSLPHRPGGTTWLGRATTLAMLTREIRPLAFYFLCAMLFCAAGLVLAVPVLPGLLATGAAPPVAPAILAAGLFVVGFLIAACGLVLDSLARSRIEQKRILFLTVPSLGLQ